MRRKVAAGFLVLIILAIVAWNLDVGDNDERSPEWREMEAALPICFQHHISRLADVSDLDAARVEHRDTGYQVILETEAGRYLWCTIRDGQVVDFGSRDR